MKLTNLLDEQSKGLWHNIRAKRARGEKPAHKNSKAHKDAVKAGEKINAEEEVDEGLWANINAKKKRGAKSARKGSKAYKRASFRARHNCDNPGPKTKARYWSCRKW